MFKRDHQNKLLPKNVTNKYLSVESSCTFYLLFVAEKEKNPEEYGCCLKAVLGLGVP